MAKQATERCRHDVFLHAPQELGVLAQLGVQFLVSMRSGRVSLFGRSRRVQELVDQRCPLDRRTIATSIGFVCTCDQRPETGATPAAHMARSAGRGSLLSRGTLSVSLRRPQPLVVTRWGAVGCPTVARTSGQTAARPACGRSRQRRPLLRREGSRVHRRGRAIAVGEEDRRVMTRSVPCRRVSR